MPWNSRIMHQTSWDGSCCQAKAAPKTAAKPTKASTSEKAMIDSGYCGWWSWMNAAWFGQTSAFLCSVMPIMMSCTVPICPPSFPVFCVVLNVAVVMEKTKKKYGSLRVGEAGEVGESKKRSEGGFPHARNILAKALKHRLPHAMLISRFLNIICIMHLKYNNWLWRVPPWLHTFACILIFLGWFLLSGQSSPEDGCKTRWQGYARATVPSFPE